MKITALDIKAQTRPIRRQIDKAIKNVIDSGRFILGEEVVSLEHDIAKYCNIKHVLGVSNGTDAIILSLKALGIGSGDCVICPAFTYYATASAIARVGAVPVFADIDPKTYNICPDSIKRILRTNNSKLRTKIKAIIPVHLYGQCADMDAVMKIARKQRLKVIEDTAQAFGATYKGKKAGTIGNCGAVSFFPGKNLGAFGDAGCILTNNKIIADKLKILRNQGANPLNKYNHLFIGNNARLDSIQAAILRVKLKQLDSWNKKRAQNAEYYNKKLKNINFITPYVPAYNTHIYHQYVLKVKSKKEKGKNNKEKIRNYLMQKGIDSRTFYPIPLHLQQCFRYLKYKRGDFPESEKASKQTFTLPVHPDLTKAQLDYVLNAMKEVLGSKK